MGDKTLPAWPKELPPLKDTPRALPVWHARTIAERDYERARADAAMARLRVAVEALDFYVNEGALFSSGARAKKALTTIGDLPPDPTEGG